MPLRNEPVESFIQAWQNWYDADANLNDDFELFVNAEPFIDYNVSEGGYLSENDGEYIDGFCEYAECNYISVCEIEVFEEYGYIVVFGEAYRFAIPLDAYVEFEFLPL